MRKFPPDAEYLIKVGVVFGYDKSAKSYSYDDTYNAKGNSTTPKLPTSKRPDTANLTSQTKPVHRFQTTKEASYPKKAFKGRTEFLAAQPKMCKHVKATTGMTVMQFGDRHTNNYTNRARPEFGSTVGQDYVPMQYNQRFKKWLNPNIIPVINPSVTGVKKQQGRKEVEIDVLDKKVTEHNSQFGWPRSGDYRTRFNFYPPPVSRARRPAWDRR